MSTTPTMTSSRPGRYFSRLLVAVLLTAAVEVMLLALVMAVGAKPAQAAYPGANGKIVFTSDRTTGEGVDNPTRDYEIFSMNPDGRGLKQLTFNTASDTSPSISANGSEVAFTSNRDGNFEIYVMDSDGTDQSRFTNNSVTDDNPTISPNGFTVAYESQRNGNYEIIMSAAGFEFNLTNNSAADASPVFSPDGTKIA